MTTLRKAARQEHQLLVARLSVRRSRAASLAATMGSITMIRFLLFAAAAARAVADLHALAPVTREEHRPAVKRSAERAAKASRLLADEDGDEDEDEDGDDDELAGRLRRRRGRLPGLLGRRRFLRRRGPGVRLRLDVLRERRRGLRHPDGLGISAGVVLISSTTWGVYSIECWGLAKTYGSELVARPGHELLLLLPADCRPRRGPRRRLLRRDGDALTCPARAAAAVDRRRRGLTRTRTRTATRTRTRTRTGCGRTAVARTTAPLGPGLDELGRAGDLRNGYSPQPPSPGRRLPIHVLPGRSERSTTIGRSTTTGATSTSTARWQVCGIRRPALA